MSPESMPELSLGTAALVIFVICVLFVFLRGITRMLLGALVLGGSVWVGFVVWQKAPGWSIQWTGKPLEWISTGLPVVAFLGTFLLSRTVIGFFLKPFKRSGGDGGSGGGVILRLVLALLPTGFLWLTGATLLHHFGSIEEISKSAAGGKGGAGTAGALKNAVAAIIPPDWLKVLDPLAEPGDLSLAKVIAGQPKPGTPALIDPETGKPYPRAIIVDEPELQDLAGEGRFSTLIRHPLFQKALNDPKVRAALGARGGS